VEIIMGYSLFNSYLQGIFFIHGLPGYPKPGSPTCFWKRLAGGHGSSTTLVVKFTVRTF
jgi:hypothetical protein